MKKLSIIALLGLLAAIFSFSSVISYADEKKAEEKHHKVVIQVSTKDPLTQKIAINNAVNLQKAYGVDNVTVEIVAYGPGLSLLTQKSTQLKRIESLAQQDITFSACGNTINGVTKKTGKKPTLIKGVRVVPAGVGRLMEAQEDGYAYIRP